MHTIFNKINHLNFSNYQKKLIQVTFATLMLA